jgi:glycosyltransferase involved in cell wall biosynthesis
MAATESRQPSTVAVVIPTYNRRDLVVQAVQSVLGQSHRDLSCLVIDNGSTDGTAEALAAIKDPRLKVLSEGSPLGGPAARNVGIAAAKGAPWVAFLDSDDVWAPTKLERQLASLALAPEAAWSATACVDVGEDMTVRHGLRLFGGSSAARGVILFSPSELREQLKADCTVPAGNTTVLASRALLEQAGGFDTQLSTCDDWDLWLRFAALSVLVYVDVPLAAYRIWLGQSSSNERAFMRDAATVRARYFPEAGPLPRQYVARWEREAARRNVAAGRRLEATSSYVRAAWVGRAPGQLAYAVAAATLPQVTERRLRQLERTQRLPEGWEAEVEPWLAPYRTPSS